MSHLVLKIAREATTDDEGSHEKVKKKNLVRCYFKRFYLLFYLEKKKNVTKRCIKVTKIQKHSVFKKDPL